MLQNSGGAANQAQNPAAPEEARQSDALSGGLDVIGSR
jgi:hypothetical protein